MNSKTKNNGPLEGVRILDLTRILAGPTCTQLLGDLGADIIKIERPREGDDTRKWGPPYLKAADGEDTAESAYYLSSNRNKRSVSIDMAKPVGAKLIRLLASGCDILVENFKVGGLKRYGLSYDDLKEELPGLVYCSITGFGQTGPNAHRAGYDFVAQGMGGLMSITGEPHGAPVRVGIAAADVVCGMYASTAILAALRHRDRTGRGQHIDIGLVDTQLAWLVNVGLSYLTSGEVPKRQGNAHPAIVPYQLFDAADGPVIIAVGNDTQFARLCDFLGRPELAEDERFRTNRGRVVHRDILVPALAELLANREKAEIAAGLDARGVPAGPVNDVAEAFAEPQVKARGMQIAMPYEATASGDVRLIGNPVKLSETPVTYRHAPPTLGEHTDEVLEEMLGLDEDERRRLRGEGVL